MASLIKQWAHAVTRLPELKNSTLSSLQPNFIRDSSYFVCAFLVVVAVVTVLPEKLKLKWYMNLPEKKKSDLVSYVTATIHHSLVAPLGLYYYLVDISLSDEEAYKIDYLEQCSWLVPFITGYFIVDTFTYAIPEAFKGNLEYIIHHALALFLLQGVMGSDNEVAKYYSHMCMCEISSLFFNIAWFLRLFGRNATVFEGLFVVFFFLTRILNMPLAFFTMLYSDNTSLGWAKFTLPSIQLMQFYWFYKIVKSLTGGRKSKRQEKDSLKSN